MKQTKNLLHLRKTLLIALLILPLCIVIGQTKPITHLGIINPTPTNLHNTMNLVSKEYIAADSLAIVGIYHESQSSSIAATSEFLTENEYNNISIHIIRGDLPTENLFKQNSCTSQFEEIFATTDALIFFGGYDIPPRMYNEETLLTTEHFDKGKNWEVSFMHHLIGGSQSDIEPLLLKKPNYTILGICLGMQEMNVASGGSLYQDIPYQIYNQTTFESVLEADAANIHKNYYNNIDNENSYTNIHFHPITITPNSFLDIKGVSNNPVVASVHHQAAKDIGQNFKIVATSMDGRVVEALQHTLFTNVYGIQFHTDFSMLYDEGRTFIISPQQSMVISNDTHKFQRLFWQKFSERLK